MKYIIEKFTVKQRKKIYYYTANWRVRIRLYGKRVEKNRRGIYIACDYAFSRGPSDLLIKRSERSNARP